MSRISDNGAHVISRLPPRMHKAYRELIRVMREEGSFDQRLQELVRLKSAELAGCRH